MTVAQKGVPDVFPDPVLLEWVITRVAVARCGSLQRRGFLGRDGLWRALAIHSCG